jgi:hypothetical protein
LSSKSGLPLAEREREESVASRRGDIDKRGKRKKWKKWEQERIN